MQKNLKKVLSFVLVMVMVLGMLPVSTFAAEAQSVSELPTSMAGLSIAYPYNTETVQLTGTPAGRFDALTFESARGEVESAQMILTPSFDVTSFELTMNGLSNEKGNIIPGWAFEVYTQHYVTVSGSGNAPNYSSTYNMYNPTTGKSGWDGTYPDALIPQAEAIAAGENTIAAGKNQGIWVNLNVQDAAPGTYTGYATLRVNGSAMQIPVSVHIYDVKLPEQVHAKSAVGIWWDMVEAGEGTSMTRELGDAYFEYLVSKRIMPLDAWNITRWDDAFVDYAADYLAVSPEISAYTLHFERAADGSLDTAAMRTTLTALINKNIALANAGSNVDLFKKAYLVIYDEPRDDQEYALANTITAQLDALKAELAPMLDVYPSIKESFMDLKQLITAPNPNDKTYSKVGSFFNYFINDNYGNTALTGDSYIYAPQYQWLNTESQRALYANEEELWWYGCCHPVAPYPTYHINAPLVSARVEGWMRYAYGIDGFVYSSVDLWGNYTDNGVDLFDYWNGYSGNGTPGDQILVLPGSDYGVFGPIGTIRIENIREGNEDYEYLWMLENQFGGSISTYTAGLYEGAMPNTDVSVYYNNRKALLTKLEQLNIAANGATNIAPGQEGFDRGEEFTAGVTKQIIVGATEPMAGLSLDYKVTSGTDFGIALMSDWTNYYGYYYFNANGANEAYAGVTVEQLDDGYFRVVFDMAALTKLNANPTATLEFLYIRGANSNASGYIDNVQILDELPEVEVPTEPTEPETEPPTEAPTEPPVVEDPNVFEGGAFTAGGGLTLDLDNDQSVSRMTFDYTIESGEYFNIALMSDWSNWFGYFEFNANGATGSYAGVTTEKLDSGAIRVYVDLEEVTTIRNNPTDLLKILYIRGSETTANGTISNIRINEAAEAAPRGQSLTPGTNQTIVVGATENVTTLSFDYKITGGEKIAVALMPDWTNYYGYYEFIATGANGAYAGVTTEVLEDGYIRVTFDISALTALNGAPSKVIDFLYLRGKYCTAEGYIDNVQYTTHTHDYDSVVTEPDCENGGYTTHTCTCGDSYVDSQVDKLGHNYESVVTDPTPSNQGYTTHTCSRCGDSYVDSYTDYEMEGYLSLTEDMNVNLSLTEDFYVNLNGYSMTGTININGFKVYGIDTTTDSYTCENIGYFNCVDAQGNAVIPESNNKTELTGAIKRYLTIATENGYTFHRIYTGITHMSLKPGATGVGYKAIFGGDDMVKAQLHETEGFGYSLWLEENAPVSRGKGRESFVSGSEGTPLTLLLKNFDVENYGEARVYANVWLKLADGTQIVSSDYSYTLREMVEIINDTYTSFTEVQLDAVREMIERNPVMLNWRVENLIKQEVIRGEAVATTDSKTIVTNIAQTLETVSFEYKMVDGTKFNIALATDWQNMYGYFAFGANGANEEYAGVTTEVLEDGYIRVTFDMAALTTVLGTPNPVIEFLYIRGNDYSDANIYIDNIAYTVYDPKLTFEGGAFTAGGGLTLDLDNDQSVNYMTFDYTIESGEYFNIALMSDWSNWFGYFEFNANGATNSYPGVATKKLDDGSVRVYVDLAAVTTVNNVPTDVLKILYIRGSATTANGTISNICINEAAELAPRGEVFTAGVSKTIDPENLGELEAVSFEYKITDGEKMNIALLPNWTSFYGYFAFGPNGANEEYAGVSTELLEDGYIRVTFDMAALTKMNGTPTTDIDFLYIRGEDWTTANGYIDNVQFVKKAQTEVTYRGQKITTGESLSVMAEVAAPYTQVSFDMIVPAEGGENEIGFCLLDGENNGYYGYFYLESTGLESNYSGVTAEKLDDGYWHVTVDVAAVSADRTHGTVVNIDRVYIRNHTTDGYIDNVQFEKEEISVDIEGRGRQFVSGEGVNIDLGAGTFSTVTMEYAITNGGTFDMVVCGSWNDYYGYYTFNKDGAASNYAGITTEKLEDGFVRVTFDVAALNITTGAPTKDLKFLYISGSRNNANGYIDKISVVDYREEVIRGETFISGTNWSKDAQAEATYGAVTIDYKITDDGVIAVALLDSAWEKYYGYFEFDKDGATRDYAGVTTTKRSDGYIYVTFDVDALTNISSKGEPAALGAIRIRGSASTANGYIDNVQFKESVNPTGVRFGVLSDVHLGSDDSTWASDHLKNALTIYKNRGVDAVVITGDLQQHYKDPYTVEDCKTWMENLADVWFEVFPDGKNDLTGEPVEPILIYGNHDQLLVAEEYWPERFGEYTDAYLKEVNGYYFVGAMYQRESAAAALVDYAEENSNGYPFFYMQHCPMIDILYGEDLDATDFETGMTMRDDLWNVSNAVTFSGHTHLPATDERSIYQPSDSDDAQFTAIQVPSLNYARLADLGYDVPGDASASKQGLYVVVEGSEVNVSRLSFADSNYPNGETIGADWVFDAADPEDKPYGYETRANASNKPEFAADAQIEILSNSGDSVAFQFPAASVAAPAGFSDQIQSYYVETINVATGETVNTQSFVTHYFIDAKEANFAGPYNITVTGLAEETTYEIRVYAKEYYQVASEPLTLQLTTAKTVIRGTAITAGESLQIATNTTESLEAISFDYKVMSGERFNIAFITYDWQNYYGYIPCHASGYLGSDLGVSYEILADGYVRVTVDLDKLTTVHGTPSDVVEVIYIRGNDWSDVNGYIDNIQYHIAQDEPEVPTEPTEPEPTEPEPTEPEPTEPVIRGKAFSAGSNSYIYTDSTDEMAQFSFEYKVTNDGAMDVLIGNDNGQYGNFYLNANGTITSVSDSTAKTYAGVTTEVLADGYIRVSFQLDALENVYRGTPGSVIGFIRIRSTSTAEGYVDNVLWEAAQTDVIRGEAFNAGSSKRIAFTEGVYSTVTFDYKFIEGEEMQFAILQDSAGSAYYGRFTLNATGEKTDYAGVEVQSLSDGYYRVTINIDEVTVASGTPTVLSTFYIRGSGTNASGYIDNLTVA